MGEEGSWRGEGQSETCSENSRLPSKTLEYVRVINGGWKLALRAPVDDVADGAADTANLRGADRGSCDSAG